MSNPPFPLPKKDQFNFNTILLAIVMGLASWTLKEVNQQGKEFATMKEESISLRRDLEATRLRVAKNENDLLLVQIRLAQVSGYSPR